MEKLDARKLPTGALEEKRRLSVKLRKEGMTRAQIGEVVGVHPDSVGRWLKVYEAQGAKALKSQVRGHREGACRRLNPEQESQLQKHLIDKMPDQLKLPYALWTRGSVRELIKAQLGINLPMRTVGHYLKRWGMTPQKPVKRAYEEQPARVRQWLDEEDPQLQAKAEDTEIYWGDEAGLRNDSQRMSAAMHPKVRHPLSGSRPNVNRST